jgi:hypothetical protein
MGLDPVTDAVGAEGNGSDECEVYEQAPASAQAIFADEYPAQS